MEQLYETRFDRAAHGVCDRIRTYFLNIPKEAKKTAQEIRLRVNRPVAIETVKGTFFLTKSGHLSVSPSTESVIAEKQDLENSFRLICSYSVYAHQHEICNGFITMAGGHRVGICGTAALTSGCVSNIRDISSINIRIARQIDGCANEILQSLEGTIEGGVLLAGPPSSGKTTILRDIARQLSSGMCGRVKKVAVVDERGELAGTYLGVPQNDLGPCSDILDGYPKGEGILQAIRSLSPEFVVCDELGGTSDAQALLQGLHAGVHIISTIHAGSLQELQKRVQVVQLLRTEAFEHVVLLKSGTVPGKIEGIYKAGDLLAQISGGDSACGGGGAGGLYGVA